MSITELIKKLQQMEKDNGDKQVKIKCAKGSTPKCIKKIGKEESPRTIIIFGDEE